MQANLEAKPVFARFKSYIVICFIYFAFWNISQAFLRYESGITGTSIISIRLLIFSFMVFIAALFFIYLIIKKTIRAGVVLKSVSIKTQILQLAVGLIVLTSIQLMNWPPQQVAIDYAKSGFAKLSKHDFDGALHDYNRAIELDSKDATNYYNRGYIKQIKNDLKGALADYNKAIELNPEFVEAYRNRSAIEQTNGDSAVADSDSAKADELLKKIKNDPTRQLK
jgi:tetratricopeptide (TPR) repeat protein